MAALIETKWAFLFIGFLNFSRYFLLTILVNREWLILNCSKNAPLSFFHPIVSQVSLPLQENVQSQIPGTVCPNEKPQFVKINCGTSPSLPHHLGAHSLSHLFNSHFQWLQETADHQRTKSAGVLIKGISPVPLRIII